MRTRPVPRESWSPTLPSGRLALSARYRFRVHIATAVIPAIVHLGACAGADCKEYEEQVQNLNDYWQACNLATDLCEAYRVKDYAPGLCLAQSECYIAIKANPDQAPIYFTQWKKFQEYFRQDCTTCKVFDCKPSSVVPIARCDVQNKRCTLATIQMTDPPPPESRH